MRRFNYDDNEDHHEDIDGFLNNENGGEEEDFISPDEYKQIIEEEKALQKAQMEIVQRDINDRTLFESIRMLEKSFWWRFYSLKTRMKMIKEVYTKLKRLGEKM